MTVTIRSVCPTNTIPIEKNCTTHTTVNLQRDNNGKLVRSCSSIKNYVQSSRREKKYTSAAATDFGTSQN